MITSLSEFKNPFFIGVAGTGMSALAQYLQGIGKNVSGSDRYFQKDEPNEIKDKLQEAGIRCFLQNGEGITGDTDLVVVSTAIEDTVAEVQKAKHLKIPIIRRSELLSLIADSKKTIAVGGTSGKSTTSAMLFDILQYAGLQPGIISGAGLISIIKDVAPGRQEKIGNTHVGLGDWLVIEADESDGSIVQYKPELGILLNVDKDHKDIDTLMEIFATFRDNSKMFSVNQSHPLAKKISKNIKQDFSTDENISAGFTAGNFVQKGLQIQFTISGTSFSINTVGRHNMENALAAVAAASLVGVDLETAAAALKNYQGIYRRHQVYGTKNGNWLVDDYAHNPAKCAASIRACQALAPKVVAWFQPHGFAPTKFLRHDFVDEISKALRPGDEIWMSEIFYAGGTTSKDISAGDLVEDLKAKGSAAFFVADRNDLVSSVRPHLSDDSVLLLMGARDPSLEHFAKQVWNQL
jgi:UDP-N-acetylmuramate--alanine ligase